MTTGFSTQYNSVAHSYARQAGRYSLRLVWMLLALGTLSLPATVEGQSGFGPPAAGPADPVSPKQMAPRRRFALEETDETIYDVKFEGLQTIVPKALFSRVGSQPGKPLSPRQVREDVRALYDTEWFYSVEPRVEDSDEGPVVIFRVLERPIVQTVEFQGNTKIRDSYLEALTGLRTGSPFVVALNQEAARQIEREYKEKGYYTAKVELLKGGDKHDRDVIFKITEGKKVVISGIQFEGNKDISSRVLRTKLGTKKQILWFFGGKYDPSSISDDVTALRSYYTGLGYFDVKIDKQVEFRGSKGEHVYVKFAVDEGERYRIRNVEINGTRVLAKNALRQEMKTLPGDFFLIRNLNEDITEIRKQYGEMGRINASVEAIPKFLETPGVMDLELLVDEDEVWRIRRVNVHILGNGGRPVAHTKENVIINPMTIMPGDLADPLEIAKSKQRVNRQNLFEQGVRIEFNPVPKEETIARIFSQQPNGVVRGQMPEYGDFRTQKPLPADLSQRDFGIPSVVRSQNEDGGEITLVGSEVVEDGILQPYNPQFENNPLGDPFGPALRNPPPPFIDYREGDLDVYVQEARTGRLMFGAGVNSDSGVVGNIVFDERNFDLFRPPSSIDDIIEGRAFRGGGQTFRLEAVPGSQVSRYSASWTNPYFLDTDISLGLSGFFYQRFLDNWNEERAGGRVNFGYQFTPEWSGGVAFRIEQVNISNIHGGIPPMELLNVVGDNLLTTARANLTYDTRNSSFMPSEGHIVTGSFEQGFGEFTYPKVDLSASQYFTTYSRIDGQGKHILSFSGDVGWTGDDTPIFEKYYAGGYSSFRGFQFRGVTPISNGVETGGQFQALGSIQYQLPITADEMFSVVAFTDFGTVEDRASFDDFRISVGGGIRLQIPAMGPVPMAFDWAVPLRQLDSDEEQLFAFYVGISR